MRVLFLLFFFLFTYLVAGQNSNFNLGYHVAAHKNIIQAKITKIGKYDLKMSVISWHKASRKEKTELKVRYISLIIDKHASRYELTNMGIHNGNTYFLILNTPNKKTQKFTCGKEYFLPVLRDSIFIDNNLLEDVEKHHLRSYQTKSWINPERAGVMVEIEEFISMIDYLNAKFEIDPRDRKAIYLPSSDTTSSNLTLGLEKSMVYQLRHVLN